MRTVVLGRHVELEQLLERRRTLGQDGFDEVWEGDDHLAPPAHSDHGIISRELAMVLAPFARTAGLIGSDAFNLGEPRDYRVSRTSSGSSATSCPPARPFPLRPAACWPSRCRR